LPADGVEAAPRPLTAGARAAVVVPDADALEALCVAPDAFEASRIVAFGSVLATLASRKRLREALAFVRHPEREFVVFPDLTCRGCRLPPALLSRGSEK
jgi:hypothetical protein